MVVFAVVVFVVVVFVMVVFTVFVVVIAIIIIIIIIVRKEVSIQNPGDNIIRMKIRGDNKHTDIAT